MSEHIKIGDVTPRVQYFADGVQTEFVYPFPIFHPDDLQVLIDNGPIVTGFEILGAGASDGGRVAFAAPPDDGRVVTLRRAIPLARVTDFLQGGELRADSFNDEFDHRTVADQQLAEELARALRTPRHDLPAFLELPERAVRAARALVFDELGNVALGAPGLLQIGEFLAPRSGSLPRSFSAKMADLVSVRDFGAAGDGMSDDTPAFTAALDAAAAVFVPEGTYRITSTLRLGQGRTLFGVGDGSVIQARFDPFDPVAWPSYPSDFNAVELVAGYATLRDLRIVGGAAGIKLYGRDGPCVKNLIDNVSIWDTVIGIVFDGDADSARPCYWNHAGRVLCARPQLHGVLFTVSGGGDTPNANKLHDVRVYSIGAPMTGCGFFVSAGRFNNAFLDCEANLHPGAEACFRLGYATDQNLIVNFYAESSGAVPAVRIDGGSRNTAVLNLMSATAGAPIWDTTGAGDYTAFNAGHPVKNTLKSSRISDLTLRGLRYETVFVEPPAGGLVEPDLAATTYLVSAYGGPVEFRLPAADPANGRIVRIKKTDIGPHPVTVTEAGGPGPDHRSVILANRYDAVTVVSNGANWWVQSSSERPVASAFFETPGVVEPSLRQPVCLVSAWSGAVELRLPAAGSAQAQGRQVTVKKTDPSGNWVTVTESGGPGPDGGPVTLAGQFHFVTVFSNGTAWHILGRYF